MKRARQQKEVWRDSGFIGCFEGPEDLSSNYKKYLAETLDEKYPPQKNSILTDSGFWLALANRRDQHHRSAAEAFDQFESLLFIMTVYGLSPSCRKKEEIHRNDHALLQFGTSFQVDERVHNLLEKIG